MSEEFSPVEQVIVQIIKDHGASEERQRIIDILTDLPREFSMNDYSVRTIAVALERINNA